MKSYKHLLLILSIFLFQSVNAQVDDVSVETEQAPIVKSAEARRINFFCHFETQERITRSRLPLQNEGDPAIRGAVPAGEARVTRGRGVAGAITSLAATPTSDRADNRDRFRGNAGKRRAAPETAP